MRPSARLGFFVLALLLSTPSARAGTPTRDAPAITVDPPWVAEQLAHGALAVDVRAAADYARGHLPGAIRALPPEVCAREGVECLRRELGKRGLRGDERVVLYGGAESGEAIATLFWRLEQAGLSEVRILDGGIAAWQAANRPLETRPRHRPARAFGAPAAASVAADAAWVRERCGLAGIEILDLRDAGIWMDHGYAAPPAYAAGHLPHSLPYDFSGWLPAAGRWPAPDLLRARLAELGPRAYTPVDLQADFILYGQGPDDPALGLGYLSLRRLGLSVRVFADGFAAWAADPRNPVVRIVGPEEVRRLLEAENPGLAADRPGRAVALLDLREGYDFQLSHVPGALNLPAYDHFLPSFEAVIRERWPAVPRTELPLIFYCYGRECIRSRDGCSAAARLGFTRLLWLRDGLTAWTEAGFPLTPPTAPPASGTNPGSVRRDAGR